MAAPLDLATKYTAADGTVFLTGVQAIVRVALDQLRADRAAGLHTAVYASGYPGSPLGGLDQELQRQQRLAPDGDLVHVPGHNEDLAATAITGTQLVPGFTGRKVDGVVGLWYGKGPGLDRSGDAFRHAQFVGTSRTGGVVAFVGDDPACKSSSIPHDTQHSLRDLDLPILYPGTVQEIVDLGRHAVAVSRFSGLWSAMRIVSNVADGAGTVDVGRERLAPIVIPDFEWNGAPFVPMLTPKPLPPATNLVEPELLEARIAAARAYEVANGLNRITVDPTDSWLGIVAPGRVYYDVVEALDRLGLSTADLAGLGVRLLHVRVVHPVDAAIVRRFARGLDEILVVEEKRPLLESTIKELLYGTADQPLVTGKRDERGAPLVPVGGALDVDRVLPPLLARLRRRVPEDRLRVPPPPRQSIPLLDVARAPYFCSGCPHNTGVKAPKDVTLGGGIGCHSIAVIGDPELLGEYVASTHMGAEGMPWVGIEPFVDAPHFVQNMGDGTYFHSGQLAVQAAVAAGTKITFKLLYNSAVAMTGGQDTAMSNARPVPDLATSLLAQGVRRVVITTDEPARYRRVALPAGVDVRDRREIVAVQEELATVDGVTVLIHDQQCAAEKRRDRKRGRVAPPAVRVHINERVCEGCGDCARTSGGCLSLEPVDTEYGRRTQVNQASCNVDLTCLDGDCPSFVTSRPARAVDRFLRRPSPPVRATTARPPTPGDDLPEPARVVGDDVTIRMPGIGGTGVVTVSQILGTAALLGGRHVWGLDQTGLSQKAGPVVSDLRITTGAVERSNKPAAGAADVYLAFDLVVGLSPQHLVAASPERTVGVASTSLAPTGAMVTDPRSAYPTVDRIEMAFAGAMQPGHARFADATRLATALVGSPVAANVLLLGVAYQSGYLPVTADDVEQAIRLNGVGVDTNLAAFRWGRRHVVDPGGTAEAAAVASPAAARPDVDPSIADAVAALPLGDDGLRDLVTRRAADLVAYQDRSYADRYLAGVAVAAKAEAIAAPGSTDFTDAVACHLHKLMAYKDEYEVARLHLDFPVDPGPGRVATLQLHPPALRALGLDRKIGFGPASLPLLRALRAGARLRGTAADPFGWAKVRRVERALVREYEQMVTKVAQELTAANVAEAAAIAALPDLVRGYEDVKLGNVERYRDAMTAALASWDEDRVTAR